MSSGHDARRESGLLRFVASVPDDVLGELRTARDGLSPDEAELRLKKGRSQRTPEAGRPRSAPAVPGSAVSLFALMLWAAAALAFVGEMPHLGVAILVAILVNGVFSFAPSPGRTRRPSALGAAS